MSQTSKKVVHVAVGVVVQNQCVLLAKRAQHQHQGGLWEFPGGKVEPNESVADALTRELQEELAIQVENCQPLMEIHHDYSDKSVWLDVWVVDAFTGEPKGVEGQPLTWASAPELGEFDFPEANVAIVEKVRQVLQS